MTESDGAPCDKECDECYKFCNKQARDSRRVRFLCVGSVTVSEIPRESVSQYPSDIECNHVLNQPQFFFLRSVVVFCLVVNRWDSCRFVNRFLLTENLIVTKYLRCSGFLSQASHPPHRVGKIVDFCDDCDRGVDLNPFLSFLDRSFHAFFTAFCS